MVLMSGAHLNGFLTQVFLNPRAPSPTHWVQKNKGFGDRNPGFLEATGAQPNALLHFDGSMPELWASRLPTKAMSFGPTTGVETYCSPPLSDATLLNIYHHAV